MLAGLFLLTAWAQPCVAADTGQAPSREVARLAEKGESIFQSKCSSCHSLGGGDRASGPDLEGVTERRDRQWLLRVIREPDELIAEEEPRIMALMENYQMAMPDLGVSRDEAEALLAYLEYPGEEQHAAGEAGATREQKKIAGDPLLGRQFFVGKIGFEKGGAPCLACHGFDKIGPGGAASYGGDLTALWESYGGEGVRSILADLPFPSMAPVYSDRPLTEAERADLAAFFKASEGSRAPGTVSGFFLRALLGAAVLFAAALVVGWRRLTSVRRSLVEKTPHSKS